MAPAIEMTSEEEPPIMIDELGRTIKAMKKQNAPGSDCTEAETWQIVEKNAVKMVWHLCDGIWRYGKWPSEMV